MGLQGAYSLAINVPDLLPNDNFSAPDTLYFEVTRECNLRCRHCFNSSAIRLPNELTSTERLEVVRNAAEAGVQEVRLSGGEPLLLNDLPDLVSAIRDAPMKSSIGTNGSLITIEIATELKKNGLNESIVSIDGAESTHDSIRGHGSYRATIRGIEQLLAVNIPVRVNIVAMKSNVSEIPTLVRRFTEFPVRVMVRRYIASGRAAQWPDQAPSSAEYDTLRRSLLQDNRINQDLLEGHHIKTNTTAPRVPLPFNRRPCSAGQRGIAVMPTGEVQTCGFMAALRECGFGWVHRESFLELWRHIRQRASTAPTSCATASAAASLDLLQISGAS
jgi:MoaA/NifB/PqqE/SkfB family radical SAM enzyme